ncbi:hypothetical protein HDU96_010989, partial [Phlyctochytrium bullatum]
PLAHCRNELNGFKSRATWLLTHAPHALAPTHLPASDTPGFSLRITREPVGVVLLIAAWNYPYLIAVNGLVPALVAGNAVLIKHAPQTFLVGERLARAAERAGVMEGVVQAVCAEHEVVGRVMGREEVGHVQFTGSVRGGREVGKVVAERFISLGLELGGKDPAYVRGDVDPRWAASNVLDGAFYNAGQSCCAVERVYVHESVYDAFVAACRDVVAEEVRMGMPFEEGVTLGPVVSVEAAERVREQVREAVAKGARGLVEEGAYGLAKEGSAFVAPQVVVGVDHSMRIMTEETFGPVVGVMKVRDDEEAIGLMNDSKYGLTASVWTHDMEAAEKIMQR